MQSLKLEANAFAERKRAGMRDDAQCAALAILCGIDLGDALSHDPGARQAVLLRLRRLIERERLKGAARHWSYDLNRHIALKQARDHLLCLQKQRAEPAS